MEKQWDNIMTQANNNVDVLNNPENVKLLGNILKTNVSACSSIGNSFIVQYSRIFMDMLGLYRVVSELISEGIATQGNDIIIITILLNIFITFIILYYMNI